MNLNIVVIILVPLVLITTGQAFALFNYGNDTSFQPSAIGSSTANPNPGNTTSTQFCNTRVCHTPSLYTHIANNSTDITGTINFGNQSFAQGIPLSHSQLIGIQLSQACIKLEEHNIRSNCLTYDKIKSLDNTNPLWSGQWVNHTGFYHRLLPKISNAYISNNNTFVVMVDPDPDYTARAKMIIIQSDNFTYTNPTDNATNTKLIEHINRFVTQPCEGAIVAPNISLVADTVHYLENGCTQSSFNDTVIIPRVEIPFDYNNPYSSLHYSEYLKSIYHTGFLSVNQTGGSGIGDCIHFKCNFKDPFSNWGVEFIPKVKHHT